MELKHPSHDIILTAVGSFNRTIMELKRVPGDM